MCRSPSLLLWGALYWAWVLAPLAAMSLPLAGQRRLMSVVQSSPQKTLLRVSTLRVVSSNDRPAISQGRRHETPKPHLVI